MFYLRMKEEDDYDDVYELNGVYTFRDLFFFPTRLVNFNSNERDGSISSNLEILFERKKRKSQSLRKIRLYVRFTIILYANTYSYGFFFHTYATVRVYTCDGDHVSITTWHEIASKCLFLFRASYLGRFVSRFKRQLGFA